MDKLHRRLRWARIQAGCGSARAGAERAAVADSLYVAHETGGEPFGVHDALRYAAAFNVNVRWLLIGAGPVEPGPGAGYPAPGPEELLPSPAGHDATAGPAGGMAEQAAYFASPFPVHAGFRPDPGDAPAPGPYLGQRPEMSFLEEAHFRALEIERQLMGGPGSLEDFFRIVLRVYNDLITRNDESSRR